MSDTGGAFPEPVERLIAELAKLPGVGRRSAERMAFYILKSEKEDALKLARAIDDVKKNVKPCSICRSLSHLDPCAICRDQRRDASTVLIVEHMRDLINLEATGAYHGVYHVLGGRLDPLAGVGPEKLAIEQLIERIEHPKHNSREVAVKEIILGLSPDMEGDTTALYLSEQLTKRAEENPVAVTRLARGLPSGSQLEYASKAVLSDAIRGRRTITE